MENWGKDTKNGKEEVFIFVFNHRISSFGNIAHDQWSQYGGLYFIVEKLVSSFFEVILKLLLFWKKSWILQNYSQTLWNY